MLKLVAMCFSIVGLVPGVDGFQVVRDRTCNAPSFQDPSSTMRKVADDPAEEPTWLEEAEARLKTKTPCVPKDGQRFINEDGDHVLEIWSCKGPKGQVDVAFAFANYDEGHWAIFGPFVPMEK